MTTQPIRPQVWRWSLIGLGLGLAAGLGTSHGWATVSAPPRLEPAILNGEPVQVLYLTQAGDQVLVRCYPGYGPTLQVRTMGANPQGEGQQEGVLTCEGTAD